MKVYILAAFLLLTKFSFSQSTQCKIELVHLAKIYRYHADKQLSPADIAIRVNVITSPELNTAKKFIAELAKPKNDIGAKEFLAKPDSLTLKYLYVVRQINYNFSDSHPVDNEKFTDSLLNEQTDYKVLLANYYGIIFSQLINSSDGFNMTGVDFKLNEYNLKGDSEKSIFFLTAMERLNALIWGYMNIPKPPNYEMALAYINKFPQFNGQPYYYFTNLDLEDFYITVDKRKPKESFKRYYLNRYINTLIYHFENLAQLGTNQQQKQNLLDKSILKNRAYWQYSKQPDVLEAMFKSK